MKDQVQVQTTCYVYKNCVLCSIKVEAFVIFKTKKMPILGDENFSMLEITMDNLICKTKKPIYSSSIIYIVERKRLKDFMQKLIYTSKLLPESWELL